jgi:LPS-assembly protein
LTAQFGNHGLSVTPNAGVRGTFYDRSASSVEPTERKYYYAGTDVNARVSRVYGTDSDVGIGKLRHSIEPTISYSYVPHVEQGDLPQFDPVDSVPAQNLINVALLNRVTARYKETKDALNYSTFDVMVFKLSRSYDFNIARENLSAVRPGSGLFGELYLRTPKTFSMSASGMYDVYTRVVNAHSETAAYTGKVVSLNLTHSFAQGGAEYLISGGGLALSKWNLHAQVARDIQNKKTTQEEYLLHYTSQCWGLRVTYTVMPGEHRYTAMIDLKGLGSRGTK